MAKEFNIILNNHLSQFDIFLNNRLTQCDIVVHSIPFRDSLTSEATVNRVILESSLENYALQKFVDAQTSSELISHIGEIIKKCIERLDCKTYIDVAADNLLAKKIIAVNAVTKLSSTLLNLCYLIYADSESAMQFAASVLDTEIHFSLGGGATGVDIIGKVSEEYATKYETAQTVVSILAEALEQITKYMEPESNGVQFAADVTTALKHYRMLKEMDEDTLLSYDDMTLEEVDYIIL